MIKDYRNRKCCLNCDGFCWWDGDYCCVKEMKIHQYGFHNGIWMNSDIDRTMKTPETCEDYNYVYHEEYNEEYNKFKEWDILYKQLEDHVNDKSSLYKNT